MTHCKDVKTHNTELNIEPIDNADLITVLINASYISIRQNSAVTTGRINSVAFLQTTGGIGGIDLPSDFWLALRFPTLFVR